MSSNSSSIPNDGAGRQSFLVESYEIAIIDCGCWDNEHRYFGAMNGSVAILARMNDHTVADELGGCRSNPNGTIGECEPTTSYAVPFSGLSEAQLSQLRELSPVLIQFLWQLVRVGPGGHFSVEVLDAPYVAFPVLECEDERRGELLSPASELSIFLPDMHLGVLDTADDFAQKSTDRTVQTENLKVLHAVVETARMLGANIYQMGDFLDVWEVEACLEHHSVYFGKPLLDVTVEDVTGPDKRPWREDRKRRSIAAELLILERWNEVGAEAFRYIRSEAGIRWIHGNHDAEVGAQEGALISAPRPIGDVGHWRFREQCPQSVWVRGVWAAEHGHYYDRFNDTRGVATVADVLEMVPGKTVTYANARRERTERVPFAWVPTGDGGVAKYFIHDPADTYISGMTDGTSFVHMFSHHPLKSAATAGDLLPFSPFQPHTTDGAGLGERANFDDMRFRLVDELFHELKTLNPNSTFAEDGRYYEFPNRYTIPFLVSRRLNGHAGAHLSVPRTLPFRVLFHGHTHQPMILRVRLVATQ